MNKKISILLSAVLIITATVLGILLIKSIKGPIDLDSQKEKRFALTIERLKDIREFQKFYKEQKGRYTASFDSLMKFIATDSLKIVTAIGSVPESLTEEQAKQLGLFKIGKYKPIDCTEAHALKLGLISRDTIYVSFKDTLFGPNKRSYSIKEMPFIPVGSKAKFVMDTNTVMTGSGIAVNVFQCYAHYDDVLQGLDNQYIINEKSRKKEHVFGWKKIQVKDSLGKTFTKDSLAVLIPAEFKHKEKLGDVLQEKTVKYTAVIRVGKLNEANNNAGNWE